MSQIHALLLSLIVEGMVIFIAFKGSIKPAPKLVAIAIAPTMITHPILWTTLLSLPSTLPYLWAVGIGEIIVILVEGVLLKFLCQTAISTIR